MKSFSAYIDELNEAEMRSFTVKFKKTTFNGKQISDKEFTVDARSPREAITKVGNKMGLNAKDALSLNSTAK